MNVDKAIEIKARTGDEFLNTDPDEIDEAERLSIEALKEIKHLHKIQVLFDSELLPGETKD